ncbi:MAG: hypothetical protein IJN99_03335 [Clostridia bacterium]|nr:hypothetical protein [Clostridia bacterium]
MVKACKKEKKLLFYKKCEKFDKPLMPQGFGEKSYKKTQRISKNIQHIAQKGGAKFVKKINTILVDITAEYGLL